MAEPTLESINTKIDIYIELQEEMHKVHTEKIEFLISCQNVNAASIANLKNDTSDIIKLYKNVQGAARVGVGVQNFLLWVAKFGIVGTAAVALSKFVAKHFMVP